jgi:O-antigen/teichoic acid export membrane protein
MTHAAATSYESLEATRFLTTATIESRRNTGAVILPAHTPESAGRSIARGGIALLRVQPLTWGASLLSTVLLPRLVGSDVLGQLTIATTIIAIAATVCGLGISEFLVRRVAQQPHTLMRDQGIALTVQMIAAGLGFLAVVLLGWRAATAMVDYRLLMVAAPVMLVAPAQTVLMSSFRGREQHRSYAWFCAATTVLCMLGGVVALLVGGDAVAFLVTSAILLTTTTLVGWKLSGLRPSFPTLNPVAMSEAWEFIRAGFPFLCWQITQLAYSQIDRLLLGVLVPASEVGWYAAANRIVAIPLFIPTLIVTPLFPALSRSANQPDVLRRTIAQTLRFTLLLTVPLSAGTIVISSVIPSLLGWPPDFANAALPMSVLALQLPLVAAGMVLGSVLMAIGRASRLSIIASVATAFNIAANLLVIPALQALTGNGGTGAAIVTVGSEIVMLIGMLVFIPKHLFDIKSVWDAARITLAGLATAIVGLSLLPVSPVLSVLAGAAAYCAVAALLRVLTTEDVRLLIARLRNR